MTRPALLLLASTSFLAGCAGPAAAAATPRQATYVAAHLLAGSAASSLAAVPPVVRGEHASSSRSKHRKGGGSALARVESANRSAVREPEKEDYVGAVQVYPWSEGALYRLYAAPGQVSDIALQPGESLISVAAGDTVRWIIGDTSSGAGAARRTHILVKPSAAGLTTNLVIATDRRVYHVEAKSSARAAMASIAWSYPEDALVALRGSGGGDPVSAAVAVDELDFDYRIEGDRVSWRPLRAFDDGRQVFIEFPPALAQGAAPPLFVTGEKGRAEIVNYRIRGRYYVVDRLFDAAELRMGEKHQKVVRIVRGSSRSRRGRGR